MIKTRITEMLGMEHPIQVGTMMHISNAEFVAACVNAGVFACLASAMYPDKDSLVAELAKLKSLTHKPFGVNVSLFPGHDTRTADVTLDILAEQDIEIIETAGRSPESHLKKIRQNGAIHIHKCARLRDAVKVDQLGVDIVTVVGAECGGHPGMEDTSSMVLVPEVAGKINSPLIAGGGFCDGKGLMAALALGADAVLMGTRFLNSFESKIHKNIKQKFVETNLTNTIVIQKSIKSPVRVLDNEWARKIQKMEQSGVTLEELLPKLSGQLSGKAWINGSMDAVFPCGQVIGRTEETLPVKDIVIKIISDAIEAWEKISRQTIVSA